MLAMKNRKYLPKKPWKRFTSTPLPENADWHLFCQMHCNKFSEFRALREYSHALRLENASLRESLSDLRAANANRIPLRLWRAEPGPFVRSTSKTKTVRDAYRFCFGGTTRI